MARFESNHDCLEQLSPGHNHVLTPDHDSSAGDPLQFMTPTNTSWAGAFHFHNDFASVTFLLYSAISEAQLERTLMGAVF
ncbi:hypothetical protein LIA77_10955 [Sarocladium implicatum]|nr:hypothetical protein LIA77_10955 [Sarocladium implicatum]